MEALMGREIFIMNLTPFVIVLPSDALMCI